MPRVTHTANGIPGDALNVALVGTEDNVKTIMRAARWHPADPLGLRNDLRIAEASVLKQSYDDAPVSDLYLFGHKQVAIPIAAVQQVGDDGVTLSITKHEVGDLPAVEISRPGA